MSSTHRISLFASLVLVASAASAQTVVFKENWESGTTSWRTTGPNAGGDVYFQDTGATAGAAMSLIAPAADPTSCAGSFLEEGSGKGKASVGGRVFTTGANAVAAAMGDKYCVAAWVRGAAGSSPAVGVNYIKKSVGYSDTRVAAGGYRSSVYREHWLALAGGGASDGYSPWARSNNRADPATRDKPASDPRAEGPVSTPNTVLADIAAQQAAYGSAVNIARGTGWMFTKAHFTVTPQDLKAYETGAGGTDVAADAFILKLANYTGSGAAGEYFTTAPAQFGDVFVVKLDAAATECPDDAYFAPITSVHTACTGATPLCVTTGAGANAISSCGACNASKGESGTLVCGDAKPVCEKTGANTGACSTCSVDNGLAGLACASANPYCSTKPGAANMGTCGKCTMDADCLTAAGGKDPTHAGVTCDVPTGACTTGCFVDADCTGGWCEGASGTTVSGKCKPKLANGTAIPASRGAACTGKVGVDLCESGRCDTDNTCGLKNASDCTAAAQCRGGVCDGDKCGRADGGACSKKEECRGNECTASKCGPPCASDAECGGSTSGNVCDAATGACAPGCRGVGGNGCAAAQTCSSKNVSIGSCAATPATVIPVAPATDAKSGCSTTPSTSPSNGAGLIALSVGLVAGGLVRRRCNDASKKRR